MQCHDEVYSTLSLFLLKWSMQKGQHSDNAVLSGGIMMQRLRRFQEPDLHSYDIPGIAGSLLMDRISNFLHSCRKAMSFLHRQ